MTSDAGLQLLLQSGVRDHIYPGAVWAVGDASSTKGGGAVGVLDPETSEAPMCEDTIFDIASLTKIVAVWSTIGALWEDGLLALDVPLGSFWPETKRHPVGQITAHHLLTHTAGLPARAQLQNLYGTDPRAIRAGVLHERLPRAPGEAVEYTDRAALILGYLVEYLSGEPLEQLATKRVWKPLNMAATRFGPLPPALAARCAPTEFDPQSGRRLRGTAHDFSARLLGGVCGIAGVFSIADDLGAFLRYLLGVAASPRPGFGTAWIAESLKVRTGHLEPPRGLFWHPAPSTSPEDQIWVHYGFTGTAMWLCPKTGMWAVLLTNKLYYTRDRSPINGIRDAFRELALG